MYPYIHVCKTIFYLLLLAHLRPRLVLELSGFWNVSSYLQPQSHSFSLCQGVSEWEGDFIVLICYRKTEKLVFCCRKMENV